MLCFSRRSVRSSLSANIECNVYDMFTIFAFNNGPLNKLLYCEIHLNNIMFHQSDTSLKAKNINMAFANMKYNS